LEQTQDKAPVLATDFGLYVHFPYCLRICPYCDFNVYAGAFDGVAYADTVIKEIEARAHSYLGFSRLRSIYFGGGTPSLWGTSELERIIQCARETFGLHDEAEITIECNPEKLEQSYLSSAREIGINRISLGSQSLVPKELVQLGRMHQAQDSIEAIAKCSALGFSISVDIIFGTPDQSESQLDETLDALLCAPIQHISAYGLSIETGTAFGRQMQKGKFHPMSDDDQARRMRQVSAKIREAEFDHYEVSAFAQKGHRAIHNSLYWVGAPFIGVGAGAHSYLPATETTPATRRETLRNPDAYVDSGRKEVFTSENQESLDAEQMMMEALMVGTRVKWGIDLKRLPWGASPQRKIEQMQDVIQPLCDAGLLIKSDHHIWPSERGLMFADTVARKLVQRATQLLG